MMPRITKETQREIKNLFLKIKLRQKIPKILLGDPTIDLFYSETGTTVKMRKMVKYMEAKKLIRKIDNRYVLTDFGRFAYLMSEFGLSFLEMCFFLETYHYEKMMRRACDDGFYLKYSFFEKTEDIISYGTLSNTVTRLVKKGLIYRHHKASYSISPQVYEKIEQYQEIVDRFHSWFIDTWREKNKIILQDELVSERRREYTDIYQKTVFQ